MMKKMGIVLGIGIGYVLGTRAGRGRYEQLAGGATKLWRSPPVQQAAEQAQGLAAEATERAGHAVADAVHDVRDVAKAKLHSDETA